MHHGWKYIGLYIKDEGDDGAEDKGVLLISLLEINWPKTIAPAMMFASSNKAPDNWTYLSYTLPFGDEYLDFYHASDHLSAALAAALARTR